MDNLQNRKEARRRAHLRSRLVVKVTKEIKHKATRYSFLIIRLVKKRKRNIDSSGQQRGEAREECKQ